MSRTSGVSGRPQMLDECLPGASLPICYGPAMSAIETARLLLRPWHDDDLERLVALYSNPQGWRGS